MLQLLKFYRFKTAILGACLSALVLGTGVLMLMADEPAFEEQKKAARKLQQDGNYRDAYQRFEKLMLDPQFSGEALKPILQGAFDCLQHLQQQSEIDSLLHRAIDAHPDDWQVYWKAADLLAQSPHYGFLVAGTFARGNQRGGGAFLNVDERDRAQVLIWMNRARIKLSANTSGTVQADFYRDLAHRLEFHGQHAWKLQDLTDLETLPDLPQTSQGGQFRGRFAPQRVDARGAPVDEQGTPLFIALPDSFETAQTDGERWRWSLAKMAEADPGRYGESRLHFARFLWSQFGVQTLKEWNILLPRAEENTAAEQAGVWSLPGLKEEETIARLANGVKRFPLPEEFNFIRIFQEVATARSGVSRNDQQSALETLASIFANRQQYPRAAESLLESLKRFPEDPEQRRQQLDQIIKPWGQFEPVMSTAAGTGATVDFRFRNARSVSFEAHRIRIPELLKDLQQYLETRPQQLDYSRLQIENIGYRLVQEDDRKYLGEKVADWTLELQPRPQHFDRRITVTTPLQQGGAYLVTAKVAGGNTTRVILWLNDTAIVEKSLQGKVMYFLSDAATGQPLSRLHVEFFGWKQEHQPPASYRINTRRFAEFTNADGLILVDKRLAGEGFQWLATAKNDRGRFAYLGFSGIWMGDVSDSRYGEIKTYIITDRPVYRPAQKVQFKFWIREAKYELNEGTQFAQQKFRVKINDPQGTEVFSQELETDEFGGLSGEYSLPKQAPLGSYQIFLDPEKNVQIRLANGLLRRFRRKGKREG